MLFLIPNKRKLEHRKYNYKKPPRDFSIAKWFDIVGHQGIKNWFYTVIHITKFDATKLLKKNKTPTLIVHAERDGLFSFEDAENVHKLMPNSKLYVLKGQNHRYTQFIPEKLADILIKFFK
jgi:pimeloyl-ACP methyl ester carboxylesterase